MKIIILFLIVSFSGLYSQERAITARDGAIMIDAEVIIGLQTTVTLHWNLNEQAKQYIIYRKELGQMFTETPLATLDSTIDTWTDSNVEEGKIYEYKILGNSLGGINSNGLKDFNYYAYGYKAVSINALPFSGGRLLILIDSTMADPLKDEITRYEDDILREGWTYAIRYVTRAEEFDGDKVKEVKAVIVEEFQKMAFDYIFILGRVPVPYSGDIVPDGHTNNHQGAWPADIYYGSLNESIWTDVSVNSTSAPDRTKNIPGDGKFDQSYLYNGNWQLVVPTHAAVGRVDFYDMPVFEKSEVELLRTYLDKDHKFRTGQVDIDKRAIVDNNFAASSLPGAFAWSGWANFASVVGKDNVLAGDWIKATRDENLQDKTYLMAYGDGAGSYASTSGVGTSVDFSKNNLNAVFTMLFGSYFGDWDYKNNILRAAIASEPSILTCAWAGRPHWYTHHLGLDYPIGYSTKVTLNNVVDYLPLLIVQGNQRSFPEGLQLFTHVSLLGDPTLKVNPAPEQDYLENLSVVQEGDDTKISWDKPNDKLTHKWDIFYNVDKSEKWHKANVTPITENEYLDDFKFDGKITYLVREIITDGSPTNPSIHGELNRYGRGNMAVITRTDVNNSVERNIEEIYIDLAPNPSRDYVNINFRTNVGNAEILIFDLQGQLVNKFTYKNVGNGINQLVWNLNTNGKKLNSGMYLVQLVNNNQTSTKKLIIKD